MPGCSGDWLIDWIAFYAVSAKFHPCNGGVQVKWLVLLATRCCWRADIGPTWVQHLSFNRWSTVVIIVCFYLLFEIWTNSCFLMILFVRFRGTFSDYGEEEKKVYRQTNMHIDWQKNRRKRRTIYDQKNSDISLFIRLEKYCTSIIFRYWRSSTKILLTF